jgi:hypothetical protein
MATITEQLQVTQNHNLDVTIVLRSGTTIKGQVEEINLTDGVVVVDGWTVRMEEIAGARPETNGTGRTA